MSYYYLVIAVQGFCIFHAIKNHKEYYWYLIIMFLPLVGGIIYLLTQVLNRRDVSKINSNVTSIINPTKKVKDLGKRLEFADTYKNRVDLADAYMEIGDFENAIFHFKKTLEDHNEDDVYVIENLIRALFFNSNYNEVLLYGERPKKDSSFQGSKTQFIFGQALEKLNKIDEAETNLRPIDVRYSNYEERLLLAKFLLRNNKVEDGEEIIEEIFQESKYMNKMNRRLYRSTIVEVEKMRAEFHVHS